MYLERIYQLEGAFSEMSLGSSIRLGLAWPGVSVKPVGGLLRATTPGALKQGRALVVKAKMSSPAREV